MVIKHDVIEHGWHEAAEEGNGVVENLWSIDITCTMTPKNHANSDGNPNHHDPRRQLTHRAFRLIPPPLSLFPPRKALGTGTKISECSWRGFSGSGMPPLEDWLASQQGASTQLYIDNRPSDGQPGVAQIVRTFKGLKDLRILDGWFGDDDAEELAQALAHNSSLTFLGLSGCNVNARGLWGIAEALSTNKTLDTLCLGRMRLGDIGAEIMANALASTSSSLRIFLLQECGVGVLGSRALAQALETNTCLQELDLWSNEMIGDAGATALAHALASNSSLIKIFLGKCGIGATGSRALTDALETNACLQKLVLNGNRIGDAGATALAQALASNSSLVEICLFDCDVGSTGSRALADALETNACLQKLDLGKNKIGDAGATALAHALACTTSLKTLSLEDECGIGDHGMSALVEAWGTNLALPVDRHTVNCQAPWRGVSDLNVGIQRKAVRIRDAVLRKQELLLAFGMAMIQRLGGGPEEQEHGQRATRSTREGSVFHYMHRDVFKMVGELYGAY